MKARTEPCEPDTVQPLAREEFEQIRQLAYRTFGLDLKDGKQELVCARLRRLVLGGGFRSFGGYYRSVVADTTGAGLAAMIDALATNHTSFLREADYFDFLRLKILPLLARRDAVEIWTAACSTGEEVWSLAMVLRDALPAKRLSICASDISRKALSFAEGGVYSPERCQGLPAAWLSRHFVADGRPPKSWRVSADLRAVASFRRVNLVQNYSWGRQFPVIFCRNVMIYFDKPTQEQVIRRLAACLEPGGYLFVGHAESLASVSHSLEYVQPAVYRKPPEKGGMWNR